MDCREAEPFLLEVARGKEPSTLSGDLAEHLARCDACRQRIERERALDGALRQVPGQAMPASLRARLEDRYRTPRRRVRAVPWAVAAASIAALVTVLAVPRSSPIEAALTREAVNDHLRQLYRAAPLEVVSSDSHQVKPWFDGRLDFAPTLHFEGNPAFPLTGGSVAYVVDRKAALFAFQRRLHPISLLVIRADGLPWPAAGTAPLVTDRGFNVVRWREADLGFLLVSDLNGAELGQLGRLIRGEESP
jgi:anti-sigma factor RsiW